MARKAVLSFSDLYPSETIALFTMRVASRYGIKLGDHYGPVDPPVIAFVHAAAQVGFREMTGRWMARCECGGAEVVDQKEPVFMCCSCMNEEYGRQFRNVKFPQDKEAIETILSERIGRERNWLPGESLEDLRSQNEELSKRVMK